MEGKGGRHARTRDDSEETNKVATYQKEKECKLMGYDSKIQREREIHTHVYAEDIIEIVESRNE